MSFNWTEITPEVRLGDDRLDCIDLAIEAAMLDRFQHIDNAADAAELPYVSGILLTVVHKPHITSGGTLAQRVAEYLDDEQREVLFGYLDD